MPDAQKDMRWSRSILITAIVLAVAAVVIVNVYWENQRRRQREGYIWVIEATRRIEAGQRLQQADVREVEIPPVDEATAQKLIKREQLATVLDRPLVRAAEKNQRLEWSHFSPQAGDPASDPVAKGQRGLTLPVDRKTSPGHLLRPGIYVDILATMPPNTARGQPAQTVTVLERVLVLAVGGRTLHDPASDRYRDASTITLQVSPDQGEKLTTINSYLRDGVTVVLRNSQDPAAGGADRLDEALRRLGLSTRP